MKYKLGTFQDKLLDQQIQLLVGTANDTEDTLKSHKQTLDELIIEVTPSELLSKLNGQITEDQLYTTLASKINDSVASIEEQALIVDGLSAQYTVKVDVNGSVAGFGLASGPPNDPGASEFMILANKFKVVNPNLPDDKKQVFTVGTLDGVGAVGIHGNLILDGSILANAIALDQLIVGENVNMGPNARIDWQNIDNSPNTTYIDANGLYTGTVAAEDIIAGTISGFTINSSTVNSGTIQTSNDINTQRVVLSGAANELYFYGMTGANVYNDYTDTLSKLCSIGISTGDDDYVILNVGGLEPGNTRQCIYASASTSTTRGGTIKAISESVNPAITAFNTYTTGGTALRGQTNGGIYSVGVYGSGGVLGYGVEGHGAVGVAGYGNVVDFSAQGSGAIDFINTTLPTASSTYARQLRVYNNNLYFCYYDTGNGGGSVGWTWRNLTPDSIANP